MQKLHFYDLNDPVFIISLKKKGIIKEINDNQLLVTFYDYDNNRKIKTFSLNEVKPWRENKRFNKRKDVLYFAKVNPNSDAKIPSKRSEDAGWDLYCCFEEDYKVLVKNKPNLVPTGIASAMSPKYYLNLKHERGSSAKYGMTVLAGVVDSGFRNQIWINISPTYKDVIISKTYNFPIKDGVQKPVELDDVIMYPYSVAIAQATLEIVPNVEVKEISYSELEKIPSVRGKGELGSSRK